MSNDNHQNTHGGFQPPIITNDADHQRQPPSNTTGNNLSNFNTLRIPQTPSPMNTTINPESRIAAALGRAILTIPSTSFQDATNVNPLIRTFSDVNSSANQDPPSNSPRNPLRRALSDTSDTVDLLDQDPPRNKKPLRHALSDTPPRAKNAPSSSLCDTITPTPKHNPISEKLKKMKAMVREIEQRCWEVMREEYVEDDDDPIPSPQPPVSVNQDEEEVKEECVGVERLKEGGLKVELRCSCGNGFEILLKDNNYCFYRLN